MIVCSWNVRGLDSPLKIGEIKKFMRQKKVSIIALLETRNKSHNKDRIVKKLGNAWRWEHNYEASNRGRIWFSWSPSTVSIQILLKNVQLIHCRIEDKHTVDQWFLTIVYGLHTMEDRKILWLDIDTLGRNIQEPWFIMGDFNAILFSGDREKGAPVSNYKTRDLQHLLDSSNLTETKSCGHFFSWSNKGTEGTRISSRIDRVLVISYWITKFPHVVLDYMNPGLSDHSPLLFQCHHRVHTKGKPFNFFNYMAEHGGFLQVVRDQWQLHGREDDKLKKV